MDEQTEKVFKEMTEEIMVFAVPGAGNCIDTVAPGPCQLGAYSGETLEEIQQRYPGAVMVSMAAWLEEKAKAQNTPVIWEAATEEAYMYGLEVLPPIGWEGNAFMVGEASDHDAKTGRPRYQAFKMENGKHFAASRPMTVAEFERTVTHKKGA